MPTPASIGRHPIHPILVGIPVGLWVFSLVADLIVLFGLGGPVWKVVAFYSIGGGLVGAILAAIPGVVDFLSITDEEVGGIARNHLILNLVAVALFAISMGLRFASPLGGLPVLVSAVAVAVLGLAGWLGGEMVFIHGMGVKAAE